MFLFGKNKTHVTLFAYHRGRLSTDDFSATFKLTFEVSRSLSSGISSIGQRFNFLVRGIPSSKTAVLFKLQHYLHLRGLCP